MSNPDALAPFLDSVEITPSHGGVYAAPEGYYDAIDLPPHYRPDAVPAYDAAIEYVQRVLPGVEVEPFSNAGVTAVVLHDGQRAYKVFRRRDRGYGLVENEVAALQMLSEEDITPRPLMLVDAAHEHRLRSSSRQRGIPEPIFGGAVEIPRLETSGHLPIIVTELQDTGPIDELPRDRLTTEFDRMALAALRHNLLYEDCEFRYDRSTRRAIIIDVGEVDHPQGDSSEADDSLRDALLVQSALVRFGRGVTAWPKLEDLAPASSPDKLGHLHQVLFEYLGFEQP